MADIINMADLRARREFKELATQEKAPVEIEPFTGMYFTIGDFTITVGPAMMKDMIQKGEDFVKSIRMVHDMLQSTVGLSEEAIAEFNKANQVYDNLDSLENLNVMLEKSDLVPIIANYCLSVFIENYTDLEVRALIKKNWMTIEGGTVSDLFDYIYSDTEE